MQVAEKQPDSKSEDLARAVRQARIIIAALVTGMLVFVALVVGASAAGFTQKQSPGVASNQSMPLFLAGTSVVMLAVGVLIGSILSRRLSAKSRALEEVPVERVTGVAIVCAALVEGPSLLAAVAALLYGLPYLVITLLGGAILFVQWVRLPTLMRDMAGLTPTYNWR